MIKNLQILAGTSKGKPKKTFALRSKKCAELSWKSFWMTISWGKISQPNENSRKENRKLLTNCQNVKTGNDKVGIN